METISGAYNPSLVLLSFVIVVMASFAALDLSIHIHKAKGVTQYVWLSGGAFAMGMGIWSMHFIAML